MINMGPLNPADVPTPASGLITTFLNLAGILSSKDSSGTVLTYTTGAALTVLGVTASTSITDQDFVVGSGTSAITLTLPNSTTATRQITIKHVGTLDMTIVGVSSQTIDGQADIQLRGGKVQAITLVPQGGNWWIV